MEAVLNIQMRAIALTRDLPALIGIERASFHQPWTVLRFMEFFSDEKNSGRIYEVDGEVVGFLLYEKRSDRLHIAHIAVKPKYRGQGIGRDMIRSLGDHARAFLTLNVRRGNTDAQRLYYNLGFELLRCIEGHYPDGEDAFLMGYRGFTD